MRSGSHKQMRLAVALLLSHHEHLVQKFEAKKLSSLLTSATLAEFATNLVSKPYAAVKEIVERRDRYYMKKLIKTEYLVDNAVLITDTDEGALREVEQSIEKLGASQVLV